MISRSLALFGANARVGAKEFIEDNPPLVLAVGVLLPSVMRLLVYVLIGAVAAGQAGAEFAFIGVIPMAIVTPCVNQVSDIPVFDVEYRRYGAVRRGSLPVFLQYFGRAAHLMLLALATALVCTITIGLLVWQPGVMTQLIPCLALLLVTIPVTTVFGLATIAPAIGNDYQNLVGNTTATILTVCSGAIFPTTINPVLNWISQVMPLHHTVNAFRLIVAGQPFWGEIGYECLVGAGWFIVGLVVYWWFDRRGRTTGRGAFAS